jgi:hypothetical protein
MLKSKTLSNFQFWYGMRLMVKTLIKELSNPDLPDHTASVKSYIDMLLERKKELFPDSGRTIVDCQFSGSGSKLRLDVASSL